MHHLAILALVLGHHARRVTHSVAPAAMRLGPISHHWTSTQANALVLAIIGVIVFVIFAARRRSRRSD